MPREIKRKKRNMTLTEKAYEAIKRGILRGEIEEGEFLVEMEVMRRYRFGRTPFREACNRLHHEGLLEVVPHRGYLVSEMSFRSVHDIFEARLILEGVIAELAALRATPAQVEQLGRLAKPTALTKRAGTDYFEARVRANTEFHLCLVRMTQNRELETLVTGILERTERLSYMVARHIPRKPEEFELKHLPIVHALRRRDPLATRNAVVGDINQGHAYLFSLDLFGRVLKRPRSDLDTLPQLDGSLLAESSEVKPRVGGETKESKPTVPSGKGPSVDCGKK